VIIPSPELMLTNQRAQEERLRAGKCRDWLGGIENDDTRQVLRVFGRNRPSDRRTHGLRDIAVLT
jgi:hypothetical protein